MYLSRLGCISGREGGAAEDTSSRTAKPDRQARSRRDKGGEGRAGDRLDRVQSVVLLSDASLKTPNETNCELRLRVSVGDSASNLSAKTCISIELPSGPDTSCFRKEPQPQARQCEKQTPVYVCLPLNAGEAKKLSERGMNWSREMS